MSKRTQYTLLVTVGEGARLGQVSERSYVLIDRSGERSRAMTALYDNGTLLVALAATRNTLPAQMTYEGVLESDALSEYVIQFAREVVTRERKAFQEWTAANSRRLASTLRAIR